MKQKQKYSFKERLAELRRADEEFVYFIAFLFALSTGEVSAVDLVKTGETSGYGKYSRSFKDIYRLGIGWSFGLAKACEMIATKISDASDPHKQLLVKLAQVIRLGDELKGFFKDELAATIHNYSARYERNLESQKLFLEMFYTISSTTSFMIASNSIMAMLMGQNNAENIFLMSFVAVVVSLGSFVFIMHMIFPRDKLAVGNSEHARKYRMLLYGTIGMGVSIGMVLFMTKLVPLPIVVVVSIAPLFLPGIFARKLENNTQHLNDWYPSFVRHFGQIYTTVGSVGQALDAVLRSDFGPLSAQIISLKNRIKSRISPEIGFELFSREAGTSIITSGNTILSNSLQKGADLNEVGNKVADISSKLNELRAKRRQTSKTFETIVIVMHALTMAILGLMSKLTEIFNTLLSTVSVSNQAITLSPINPEFMNAMMPIVIVALSTINGFAIKVGQGGLYKTVWYYIALLGVIGGITMYGTTAALSDFLSNHILDIYQTPP